MPGPAMLPAGGAASREFDTVRAGDDRIGGKVKEVLYLHPRFVVYFNQDNAIWWEEAKSDPPTDPVEVEKRSKLDALLRQAEVHQARPTAGVSAENQETYQRIIGQGIVAAPSQDFESAHTILAEARRFLTARREEVARQYYFQKGCYVAGPLALIGLVAVLMSFPPQAIAAYAMAAALGAVGAFLSMILRMHSRPLDPEAGKTMHAIDGAARILVGAISGFVLWLVFDSKIDMGPIKFEGTGHNPQWGYLFCLVAGFSERLVPDFIDSIAGQAGPRTASSGTNTTRGAP